MNLTPVERDDWCVWCGTAPCEHPNPEREELVNVRRFLSYALVTIVLLLILTIIGWIV
jgi:hypothetical protein